MTEVSLSPLLPTLLEAWLAAPDEAARQQVVLGCSLTASDAREAASCLLQLGQAGPAYGGPRGEERARDREAALELALLQLAARLAEVAAADDLLAACERALAWRSGPEPGAREAAWRRAWAAACRGEGDEVRAAIAGDALPIAVAAGDASWVGPLVAALWATPSVNADLGEALHGLLCEAEDGVLEAAVQAWRLGARAVADRRGLGWAALLDAARWLRAGRPAQALTALEDATSTLAEAGDDVGLARALLSRLTLCVEQEDLPAAEGVAGRLARLASLTRDPRAAALLAGLQPPLGPEGG